MYNEEKGHTINEFVAIMLVARMKANIEVLGNEKVWEIIEGLGQAKVRGRFRALFFKSGGKI